MNDSKLSEIPTLGHAEEVEADAGNRVNPATPREAYDRGPLPPIPNSGGTNAPALGSRGTGDTDHTDDTDTTGRR